MKENQTQSKESFSVPNNEPKEDDQEIVKKKSFVNHSAKPIAIMESAMPPKSQTEEATNPKNIDLDLDNLPIINSPEPKISPTTPGGQPIPQKERKIKKIIFFLLFIAFISLGLTGAWYYKAMILPMEEQNDSPIASTPSTSPSQSLPEGNKTPPTEPPKEGSLEESKDVPAFPGIFQLELAQKKEALNLSLGDDFSSKIKELGNNLSFDYPIQVAVYEKNQEIDLKRFKDIAKIVIPDSILKPGAKFALLLAKESVTKEQPGVAKLILVLETAASPETNKSAMLEWEKTMVGDLRGLILGETTEDPANPEDFRFRDSISLPNSRYINLSQSKKINLEYIILADKIMVGTSDAVMVKIFELK
jgi:hypothetical protein